MSNNSRLNTNYSSFRKSSCNIIKTEDNKTEGIVFHIFSDKVSKSTGGYSVLGNKQNHS